MAEIKTLEELKAYSQRYFQSLKPCEKPEGWYTVEVRVMSYFDAMCIARNLIKACLVVIDPDGAEVSNAVKIIGLIRATSWNWHSKLCHLLNLKCLMKSIKWSIQKMKNKTSTVTKNRLRRFFSPLRKGKLFWAAESISSSSKHNLLPSRDGNFRNGFITEKGFVPFYFYP